MNDRINAFLDDPPKHIRDPQLNVTKAYIICRCKSFK